jgi:hypothetical protein
MAIGTTLSCLNNTSLVQTIYAQALTTRESSPDLARIRLLEMVGPFARSDLPTGPISNKYDLSSIVAKGDHGVDAGGSPCRNIAGEQSYCAD